MRKYFIINLKSRIDRWNSMVQQMKYGNISNYERFEAISPTWSTIHLYSENLSPHFRAFFFRKSPVVFFRYDWGILVASYPMAISPT